MEQKEYDRKFEIICQHKDSCSSNLNDKFESYGCNTLEAKVPVIKDALVDQLQSETPEQKLYHTLALKSRSAIGALEGRLPRTRNAVLRVVELDNEVVIATGPTRDRSPVDEHALDDELQKYMDERARLKANRLTDDQTTNINNIVKDGGGVEEMDNDLDEYMKEAAKKRTQKKHLFEHTDRQIAMENMEEDFDLDQQDDDDDNKFVF